MKPLLRLSVGICLACAGPRAWADAAPAEPWPQVWLNPGFYSYHFDRNADLRENNIGFGAEVVLAKDHALMAGTFINSDRQRSHYGAYELRGLHWQVVGAEVSAGFALALFDGYKSGGGFVVLPILAIEVGRVGMDLSIVPTVPDSVRGAVVFEVKLRVW
jgi:hypothetical protein